MNKARRYSEQFYLIKVERNCKKKVSQKTFSTDFPKSGWVEHDPNEIWSSQISVAAEVVQKQE
jgi:glycerol kinase